MGIRVGILGATGYTGAELIRLLIHHPEVELKWLTSEKFSGMNVSDVFPHFRRFLDLKCVSVAELGSLEKVDLAYSCLPQGKSMHFVNKLVQKGTRVIDLSVDFRFGDGDKYENWFRVKHSCRDLIKEAVYGLPEIFRSKIKNAKLVANPGCYSTSVIFGLAPAITSGLIEAGSINIDSKAGLAGAGRAPTLEHHFSEINETASVFGVNGHDQKPEMEHVLSNLNGALVNLTFVPHRIPVNRGILTTIYSKVKDQKSNTDIWENYNKYYEHERFIRFYDYGSFPTLKNVRFTNFCDIGIGFQGEAFISVVALDNLGKGAAGQAIQNMNIMFGFKEEEGLNNPGSYP